MTHVSWANKANTCNMNAQHLDDKSCRAEFKEEALSI
jgi:hypothetical protein